MNKEEKRLYDRDYREKNRESIRSYNAEYYKENRARVCARYKVWLEQNRERRKFLNKRYRVRVRTEALTHYGGGKLACVRCGFSDERTLSIDHISARMNHTGHYRKTGQCLYIWLKSQGFPDGFQTLCMNCNWIKRRENREYSDGRR